MLVGNFTANVTGIEGNGITDYGVHNFTITETEIPDGTVVKELYLHYKCYSRKLDRNYPTGSCKIKRIYNGATRAWTQQPPMQKNLSIDGNLTVKLYIDPTSSSDGDKPDVTVKLKYGTTLIGTETIYDLDSGIQLYTFNIVPDVYEVPSDARIKLLISVSSAGGRCDDGYIDVYYNCPIYDSRVEIITSTFINVDWVKTFNSPYPNGMEDSSFDFNDTVYIRAKVSDPFGSYDITGASITIEGTDVVNASMSEKYDSNSDHKIFEYQYQANISGNFTVNVTAIEGNGVTDFGNTTFDVEEPPEGVVIKELYLHYIACTSYILNRTYPTGDHNVKRINNDNSHSWYQEPVMAKNLSLDGSIAVKVYLDPEPGYDGSCYNHPDVTVTLRYGSTLIGTSTVEDIDSDVQLYTLIINPLVDYIPENESIELEIAVSDADWDGRCHNGWVDVYYDSATYDSRIEILTTTYIKVEWVKTFNDAYPNGTEMSEFNSGDTVSIRANVSDPFGTYDIVGANITIVDTIVQNQSMTLKYDSSWDYQIYEYLYTIPTAGNYTANVTAMESNSVTDFGMTNFTGGEENPNMSIEKTADVSYADPGDVITYTITYMNTGSGIAGDVWINDTIPSHTTFISSSPSYDWHAGNAYYWHFTNVSTGLYFIYVYVMVNISTPDGTVLVNTVNLSYSPVSGDSWSEDYSIAPVSVTAPMMSIIKIAETNQIDSSTMQITYIITFNNTGSGIASEVWINDTIPNLTTFLNSNPVYYSVDGDTYTWYFTDVGTGTYTIYINVTADLDNCTGVILVDIVTMDYSDANGKYYPQCSYILEIQFGDQSFAFELSIGWNLVSIPLVSGNTSVESVLSSIDGSYDMVWYYDASDASDPWKKYFPQGLPWANDLQEIDHTMGIWIHMTTNDTLEVQGGIYQYTDIDLSTGWNMISYPSLTARDTEDVVDSIEGSYTCVWAYFANDTADPWKIYDPSKFPWANDLEYTIPGFALWICMQTEGTWSFEM